MEYIDDIDRLWSMRDAFHSFLIESDVVDTFCSSLYWGVPAHLGLLKSPRLHVLRDDEHWLLLGETTLENGYCFVHPLEASWLLSSPLVSLNWDSVGSFLERALSELSMKTPWRVLIMSGLRNAIMSIQPWMEPLLSRYAFRIRHEASLRRCIDLSGGVDAYLEGRSHSFRKNLRKVEERADSKGITVVAADLSETAANLWKRIMGVERVSWKGIEGVGMESGAMHDFYREMLPRLQEDGRLRLLFAQQDHQDIGYILGGVFGESYRGLQFSFGAEWQHIGIGNLMQYRQIQAAAEEGLRTYDLGTDNAYKERWTEDTLPSYTLLIDRLG